MLWYHLDWVCNGILGLMLFALICAAYAYFVNIRRSDLGPEKKDFLLAAVFLAPFTFIPFLVLYILLLLARILLYVIYGLGLVFAVLIFVIFHRWFFYAWLHRILKYVGDKLLEANTLLIRLFLRPWTTASEAI